MGYILGSLLTPLLQKRLSFGLAIPGSLWALALLWLLYAVMPNILALSTLTAALFILGPIYNVVNSSYRLALVPDQLLYRRVLKETWVRLYETRHHIIRQTTYHLVTQLVGA